MQQSLSIGEKCYWFFLISLFLILSLFLLNLPPWFSPPSWGKVIVFRTIFSIVLFIFIASQKINWQKLKNALNFKSSPFHPLLFLLLYWFFVLLSTIFSLDIQNSLWGTPERGGGFVNFSFYILFCLFCFLIVKEKDWKKILDFSLIIAFLVTLIGFFQRFKIFKTFLVPQEERIASTLGNPIMFSFYLLPLFFLSIAFFINEKNKIKKIFYFLFAIFSLFAILFLSQTRAALLAIIVAGSWFFFAFPKKIKVIKITGFAFLFFTFILLSLFSYYPQLYQNWHPVLKEPISRFTTLLKGFKAEESRISAWKIAYRSFLERPLLGYGPENFIIAFRKNYDPNLPLVRLYNRTPLYFDRAHNIIFENLINSGIFALFSYLAFFFSLLWKLQKIKKENFVSHGLQTAFLAYFVMALPSIEVFDTFLIFYLFVSYSMHLISLKDAKETQMGTQVRTQMNEGRGNVPIKVILFLGLLIFLWQYNWIPLKVNSQINIAISNPSFAPQILENASKNKSFLNPYLNRVYIGILVEKVLATKDKKEKIEISQKIAFLAEENTKLKPYEMENWLRLGESLVAIAKSKEDKEIAKKADFAFDKTLSLSPKSEDALLDSFYINIFLKNFDKAKEKVMFCQKEFPNVPDCLWMSGLWEIYSNNLEKGEELIEKAKQAGYLTEKEESLSYLIEAFEYNKNYQKIIPLLEKLIEINPSEPQYKAALSFVYKELGQYQKAREISLKILETNPEFKDQVEEFLNTLR